MKKILIYLFAFLFVMAGTAGCFLIIKTNNLPTNEKPIENIQESGFTQLAQSVMNCTEVSAELNIKSEDQSTDLDIDLVLDRTVSLKASGTINGKLGDANIALKVFVVENSVFVEFNNQIFLTTTFEEITEVLPIITSMFDANASEIISISELQKAAQNIESVETETGFVFSLSVENLGNLSIETNKEYFPTRINSDGLTMLGKTFLVSGTIQQIPKQKVENPSSDKTYIKVVDILNIITYLNNTINDKTTRLFADGVMLGKSFVAEIYINKSMVSAKIIYNNIDIFVEYVENNFYVTVLGVTIKTDLQTLLGIFQNVFNSDDQNLSLQSIVLNSNKVVFNNIVIDFTVSEKQTFETINISFNDVKINLSVTPNLNKTLKQIQYNNVVEFSTVYAMFNNLNDFVKYEYSLDVNVVVADTAVSGKAYLNLDDNLNLNNLYFEGTINNIQVQVCFKNNYVYGYVNDEKFKISAETISEVVSLFGNRFGLEKRSLEEIKTLNINSLININYKVVDLNVLDQQISGQFANGINFNFTCNDEKLKVVLSNLMLFEKEASIELNILKNSSEYSDRFKNFSTSQSVFRDETNYTGLIEAFANTFLNNGSLEGTIDLNILASKVDIKIDWEYIANDIKITIVLDNLPANSLISNTPAITFSHQRTVIEIYKGKISVERRAFVRLTNLSYVKARNVYNLDEIDVSIVKDILGPEIEKEAFNDNKIDFKIEDLEILFEKTLKSICFNAEKTNADKGLEKLLFEIKYGQKSIQNILASFKYNNIIVEINLNN